MARRQMLFQPGPYQLARGFKGGILFNIGGMAHIELEISSDGKRYALNGVWSDLKTNGPEAVLVGFPDGAVFVIGFIGMSTGGPQLEIIHPRPFTPPPPANSA